MTSTMSGAPVGERSDPPLSGTPRVYEGADLEALAVLHRYRTWILSEMNPYLGGRSAEIGAGIGSFSESLRRQSSTIDLVEPSPSQIKALRARFGNQSGVRVLPLSAEAWVADSGPASYDTVVMINVLEHIADDGDMLSRIHDVLRPGGHLLLFVPALMILYSTIDRLVGHHRRYNRTELMQKTTAAGFQVERCRYFDLLGTVPWFLINRLGRATRFNPAAARLYDTIGVPVTRAIERLVSPPFGKNLLLVATKPLPDPHV